jgi:hypothetical protein
MPARVRSLISERSNSANAPLPDIPVSDIGRPMIGEAEAITDHVR